MCESCIDIYQTLKDVERPCRRAGCKRTWTDKRGGQLARAVRGKTGDPYPQYCENCAKEMGDLEDRQVPCKTENCTGTWTWTKQAQLAAGVRPEPKVEETIEDKAGQEQAATAPAGEAADAPAPTTPPRHRPSTPRRRPARPRRRPARPCAGQRERRQVGRQAGAQQEEAAPRDPAARARCQSCSDFLKDKKTIEIPCKTCGTPIYWPPESQLQTHLGAWAAPAMCGACKRDAIEAARADRARGAARRRHRRPAGAQASPPSRSPSARRGDSPAGGEPSRPGRRPG